MKCKCCNAPVTLEDEFCPYCGALNQAARKHIQDMRKYGGDYERTKRNVMENVDRQTRSHSKFIAIAVLILLNILTISGIVMSDNIRYFMEEREINKNWKKHQQLLENYEDEEEYILLSQYYNSNNLYSCKNLSEYDMVSAMAQQYSGVQGSIFYVKHPDVNSFNNSNYYLDRLGKSIYNFYQDYQMKDNEHYKKKFSEKHMDSMKKMEKNMQTELKAYCNLTEEDLSLLPDMDEQSIFILIGKRMGIYE